MPHREERELVFSDAAIEDLEVIFAVSLQEWGEDHFLRFRQSLIASIRNLVHQPELGRERDDLAPGLRVFHLDPHVVVYLVGDRNVEVVRVIHQRQDLRRIHW